MKKLDQFLLKAFLGPFVAILFIVIFILMLQFLWLYIDELVGKGLSLGIIAEFMFWGVCTILPMALPLATLLSSMMVVGNLAENKELMAIKASGVSLARVMLPLSIAAGVISVGAFFAGNDLVPKAYNEIFTLRDDIGRTKEEIKIPSGTFYDGIDGYILRVDGNDKKTGMMHGIMVYDHTGNKGNTALTLADSATIKMSRNKDCLIFTLYDGCNYQETNDKNYRDTSLQLQRVDFDRQELVIPLKNYAFEKSDSSRFGGQAKSMNLVQLTEEKDSLKKVFVRLRNNEYEYLRTTHVFTKNEQLDTSFDISGKSVFACDKFLKWPDTESALCSYERASQNCDVLMSASQSYKQQTYENSFFLQRADIELLKKFSQAIACFILFFIGAPLGALIKKGGLGTSAIISVLFFVLYWVVDISGTKLARDGAISASIGVFISSYVLAPIGFFLSYKAINDANLFDMDSFKIKSRELLSRALRFFRPRRVVFMGTPEFAVASLDALLSAGHKVVAVVTVPDKPSGRGLQVGESAVKKYAQQHNIPLLQPVKLKDPEFLSALAGYKADLFVVVAFRMLPEEVWSMPPLGTINLHAALLPQYRGAAPINWAVINGERMTGVTTFMIDKDIDTGGIILRQECRISPEDTAGTMHDKLMEIGSKLLVETVEGIFQHNVETRVQRSFIQGSEVLKPAPKLTRENCRINWNDTMGNVCNLVRGLSPYPAAWSEFVREGSAPLGVKIYSCSPSDLKAGPGEILTDGRTYLAVGTSDGAVTLNEIQVSGKKRMDVKSFLAGFRDPATYSCI